LALSCKHVNKNKKKHAVEKRVGKQAYDNEWRCCVTVYDLAALTEDIKCTSRSTQLTLDAN